MTLAGGQKYPSSKPCGSVGVSDLITLESLEALLCNRGSSVAAILDRVTFFVADELHAFIGSERGKQLQCKRLMKPP